MNRRMMVLGLAAAIAFPAMAVASERAPHPRIVVTGEGEAAIAPDMALISLSVMREADTARQALDENNTAMTKVIEAVKASGVADKDIQTSGLQINPRYNFQNKPDGTQTSELVGYQVTNTLSVRVRDIAKTGEVIDKAVTLGVNQGGNITFTNDDPSATIDQARKNAVANASSKARTLAEAAGVKLGRVIEITDQSFAVQPISLQAKAFDRALASVPIEAGENSFNVQVNMTFEIKP